MKTLHMLTLALAAFVSGCGLQAPKHDTNVIVVMQQFQTAREQFLKDRIAWDDALAKRVPPNQLWKEMDRQTKAFSTYVQRIKTVDVQCCPRDLQVAWLDYRQALERMNVGAVRELIELAGLAHLDTSGVRQGYSRQDVAREARYKLEKLAVGYGVDVQSMR